jgi:hypothetical protein
MGNIWKYNGNKWNICGNTLKIHYMGNIWEIHRKYIGHNYIGNTWEIYGKYIGNTWEIQRHVCKNLCI